MKIETHIKKYIEIYNSIINENINILNDSEYYLPDWQWCELKKEIEVYRLVIKNLTKLL